MTFPQKFNLVKLFRLWSLSIIIPFMPLAHTYDMKAAISYLSSPTLKGRQPGTKGHKLARDFIVQQLAQMNIGPNDPNFLETCKPENSDYPRCYYEIKHPSTIPTVDKIYNLVAHLPQKNWAQNSATNHKSCVLWMAHYDHNGKNQGHYSPGANDNASGVALILALAEWLQTQPFANDPSQASTDHFFLFTDQEELFINGSPKLVAPLSKLCRHKPDLVITLDVAGGEFFKGMENQYLAFGAESATGLRELVPESLADQKLKIIHSPIYLLEPFGISRSDYSPFRNEQIPFIFFTAGTPKYYHTYQDSVDKINFPMMNSFLEYLKQLGTQTSEIKTPLNWVEHEGDPTPSEANALAQVLDNYSAHNMDELSSTEQKFFKDRSALLKDPQSKPSRFLMQRSIIALLISVKGKKRALDTFLLNVVL